MQIKVGVESVVGCDGHILIDVGNLWLYRCVEGVRCLLQLQFFLLGVDILVATLLCME